MTTLVRVEAGPDTGQPWHFGDPYREQRSYAAGQGVVDLSHRGVIRVAGADRLTWLNSLTTQSLETLQPYVGTESLVLSPHGHIEHALHLVDDGDATWLTVEPGTAPALVQWLDSMRFMLRVEVADVSGDWAVVGEPSRTAGAAGALAWVDPWPAVSPGSVAYGPVDDHPGAALDAPRALRTAGRATGSADRRRAGRPVGLGGASRRSGSAPPGFRDRPSHDPARGRLAAHGRAPGQGLLSRPGDRGEGAQPGSPATSARPAAPRRLGRRAARAGRTGSAGRQGHRSGDDSGAPSRAGPGRPRCGEAQRPGRGSGRGRGIAAAQQVLVLP